MGLDRVLLDVGYDPDMGVCAHPARQTFDVAVAGFADRIGQCPSELAMGYRCIFDIAEPVGEGTFPVMDAHQFPVTCPI